MTVVAIVAGAVALVALLVDRPTLTQSSDATTGSRQETR